MKSKNQNLENQPLKMVDTELNSKKIELTDNAGEFDYLEEFKNRLVGAKELAKYCGFSVSSVYRLDKKGVILVENVKRKAQRYKLGKSLVRILISAEMTNNLMNKFFIQGEKRAIENGLLDIINGK